MPDDSICDDVLALIRWAPRYEEDIFAAFPNEEGPAVRQVLVELAAEGLIKPGKWGAWGLVAEDA